LQTKLLNEPIMLTSRLNKLLYKLILCDKFWLNFSHDNCNQVIDQLELKLP